MAWVPAPAGEECAFLAGRALRVLLALALGAGWRSLAPLASGGLGLGAGVLALAQVREGVSRGAASRVGNGSECGIEVHGATS